MKHRKEEDDLYRKFAKQREAEDNRIKEEINVRNNYSYKKSVKNIITQKYTLK